MEMHTGMTYYNNEQDGTALVTKTLESTNHLTPLHIPPGPPISPERYEELREIFQLRKPILKGEQESEPLLPEAHRIYEPPYKFDQQHQYYGRDAPLRYEKYLRNKSPDNQETRLVAGRHRPLHPYVHNNINITEGGRKMTSKPPELDISYRAANMLENVKKALWLSTYKRDYTGKGSMKPLLLDDHDSKMIGRATGELGKDVELRESFPPAEIQVRPLEGHIACALPGRPIRPYDLQQQDPGFVCEHPPLWTGDSLIRKCLDVVQSGGRQMPPETDSGGKAEDFQQNQIDRPVGNPRESMKHTKLPWSRFRKITDTWKTEKLYQRQLAVPPEPEIVLKPAESIRYEDLPPSRIGNYIVWHHPISLSKPGQIEASFGTCDDIPAVQGVPTVFTGIESKSGFPEWIPNCGIARPQTKLNDMQYCFRKGEAIKRLSDLTRGGMRDLRDHDRKGRRHKFYGVNAYHYN
ncbi:sperm-associated microtubule inner protein 4 [Zootoca vivipara]|uniref:sperm-associated microtubule inner protein 4 n=1 Tax=Zootoca vivipara TaxID=8524 RepID=UPI00293BC9B6|nr:sperm-associated microtubule inner protein 4 [Zootoca vivipara]